MDSQCGAEATVLADLAKAIEKRDSLLRCKVSLTAELQKKRDELARDQILIEEEKAALKKKDKCIENLEILRKALEATLAEHNAEAASLGKGIGTLSQTESYKKETQVLANQFTSAPNIYAPEKMTAEIDKNNKTMEHVRDEIQKLNIDCSSTTELTVETMEARSAELKEITIPELKQMISKLKQEEIALDEEDDTV